MGKGSSSIGFLHNGLHIWEYTSRCQLAPKAHGLKSSSCEERAQGYVRVTQLEFLKHLL